MLSGKVTPKVFLTRSVRQGYPLSPLLFAIVTHPLLVMLSNLAASRDIVVFHLPSGGQLGSQALADYSFMLLQASKKISKGVYASLGSICFGFRVVYKLEEISPYFLYGE